MPMRLPARLELLPQLRGAGNRITKGGAVPDRDDWLIDRVWSLHCRGKTVTETAKRLVIEPAEARFIIVEIWKADKRA